MSDFIFHDVEQNQDEWYQLRCGRITSSKLKDVMANDGKAFGEPAKAYGRRLAAERVTGKLTRSGYKTAEMDRGHEEEPIARAMYEDIRFVDVLNGGFFASDEKGCSPDGRVENDPCGKPGLIEIKSAESHIHIARVKRQSYDPAHKWQCIANMKWTGGEWLDFISFCSDMDEGRQLFVYRMWLSDFDDEVKALNKRLGKFLGYVDDCERDIRGLDYLLMDYDTDKAA